MDVLVSADAWSRFADVLQAGGGADVRWLRLGHDGVDGVDGASGASTPVRPDVAWMSADLFYSGLLDRFFGLLRETPDLRWVQSAAAGTDGRWFAELLDR